MSALTAYSEILDAAWSNHLAPRAVGAPTVISAFAGCGGSSLGYSMAGFKEVLMIESDDNAIATLRLNFPDIPLHDGDIKLLTVKRALELSGLRKGELDLLDGSPPCQGFSMTGKRRVSDPRNVLFKEYVRLLKGLQPRALVMENVSGLIKGEMREVFTKILDQLKSCGYQVKAWLLNAKYYNVPQSRERVIFIGAREDLNITPLPPPQLNRPFTVREAWDGLKINKSEAETKLTPLYAGYWYKTKPGRSLGRFQTTKKLSFDRPAFTIVKSEGNGGLYHPSECRMLHLAEFKRIASYPDAFQFTGRRKDWQERIGNSVPPLFMKAIAEHVSASILRHCST